MKTKTIKTLLVSSILAFSFSSCTDEFFVSGNGDVQTQNRQVDGFVAVSSSGDFHVNIVHGTDYAIQVKAESNLLPYIETSVSDQTLKIRTTGVHSITHHSPIEVFITQPELTGIKLSGSGVIKTDHFTCENIYLNISGSGDIDTQLNANQVNASISGSGKIYLDGAAKSPEFRKRVYGKLNG